MTEEAVKVPQGERDDLQGVARDLGRWQGTVDSTLASHTNTLARLDSGLEKIAGTLKAIEAYIASQSGGEVVQQRLVQRAATNRMWIIGLTVTTAISLTACFLTAAGLILTLLS